MLCFGQIASLRLLLVLLTLCAAMHIMWAHMPSFTPFIGCLKKKNRTFFLYGSTHSRSNQQFFVFAELNLPIPKPLWLFSVRQSYFDLLAPTVHFAEENSYFLL